MSGPRAARRRPCPASGYGAIARHADSRGAFRELWRASAFPALTPAETGAPAGSRAALRPGQPLDLGRRRPARPPLPPPPARLLGRRRRAGRSSPSSTSGRSSTGRGAAVVETRELAADDWVVIPAGVAHGFLALEPLELLYLVTNEFDGSDELGFAWDDPAVGVPWPRRRGDPGRPPDPVRARPVEPVARASWWPASAAELRRGRRSAHRRRPHHPTAPLRPPPYPAPSEGAMQRRDHPAIGPATAPAATLRMHSSRPAGSSRPRAVLRSGARIAQSRRRPRRRARHRPRRSPVPSPRSRRAPPRS